MKTDRRTPILAVIAGLILFALGAAGCGENPTPPPTLTNLPTATHTKTATPAPTTTPTPRQDPPTIPTDLSGIGFTPIPDIDSQVLVAYTYPNPDGNRYITGTARMDQPPVILNVPAQPRWILGVPTDSGSFWAVVFEDGTIQGFSEIRGRFSPVTISPGAIDPDTPPLLMFNRGVPSIVTPPIPSASRLTHPAILGEARRMAFIDGNGDLVLWDNGERNRLALDALPDARILQDENQRLLLLTGSTDIYNHAVLGDGLEASTITLVATNPRLSILQTITLPPGDVIEGIAPIWTDLDGDGVREIIVTVSNETDGARLVVFAEDGTEIAASPPIGRGFRWRHQLLAAPIPLGSMGLFEVVTPHLSGTFNMLSFSPPGLEIVTSLPGFRSHMLGSRNLDMALGGQLTADTIPEILVPDAALTTLRAIQWDSRSAQVTWTIPLADVLTTNIAAFTYPKTGGVAVGVGLANNTILIWLP